MDFFPVCNKHSILTAKIGKRRKSKFGRINSKSGLIIAKRHFQFQNGSSDDADKNPTQCNLSPGADPLKEIIS